MTTRPYLAFVVFAIAVAMQCSTEQIMNFDKLEYLSAQLPQAPESLTINAAGQTIFESHTNAHKPDYPEIGRYEMKLGDRELSQLRSRLSTPPFNTLTDHWGNVMPSDRYKRISVTAGSEKIEKLFGSKGSIPAAARDLIDYLDQIVGEVLRYPRQTLRSELSGVQVNMERVLTAKLTLSNSGDQPALFRHPASLLNAPDGHLYLQAWPDKPDVSADDVLTLEVKKVLKPASTEVERLRYPVVEIPAKGVVAFQLEAELPKVDAGVYLVRVDYQSLVQLIDGYQLIYGQLLSRTTKVKTP